jgi:L-aminopeptidase/D-esterase-like protein
MRRLGQRGTCRCGVYHKRSGAGTAHIEQQKLYGFITGGFNTKTIDISQISGIKIGHAQNLQAATGCSVVICEEGAVAGVDVRGGSPGTRETDALNPVNMCQSIHAVLLAGGSAFGLDAAAGVMQYLEERNIGLDVSVTKVPIVCGAVLFDLMCGDYKIRPDKSMGFDACMDAENPKNRVGSIGAGTGALIGKIRGNEYAMKGGLGTYAVQAGNLQVGAVVAVNCVGDIYDPHVGRLIAGVLNDDKKSLGCTEHIIIEHYSSHNDFFSGNTVIGVVVTNADMTKAEANKLASISQNGLARTIRPAHSNYDGDTIFTMATGEVAANQDSVGVLASMAVENAILCAIRNAGSLFGFTTFRDIQ